MEKKSIELHLFRDRINNFLLETYPGESGRKFLHVHLGIRDKNSVAQLRKGLPGNVFILYVSDRNFEDEPDEDRVLFSDISTGFMPAKLSILVSALRIDDGHRISMSCEKGLETLFEKILPFIKDVAVETVSNIKCDKRARLIQTRCSIQNIPLIFSGRSRLLGKAPDGASALVCGAGPSLTAQLETIKENSDKFILICVGRVAKTFAKNGLKPDFVVEMDPECYLNWESSEKMDCPLAAFPIVSPEVAKKFPEIVWFFEPSSPFSELLKGKNIELPDLSLARGVIVSAIDLALKLGCQKIALAGNDLCVSNSGAAYAGESIKEEREKLFEVPGTDGGKVLTNWIFNGVRETLQKNIALFKEKRVNLKIFNCTPCGARIENADSISLEEFIKGSESIDKSTLLDKSSLPPSFPDFDDVEKDLAELADIGEKIVHVSRDIQNAMGSGDFTNAEDLRKNLKETFERESRLVSSSSAKPLFALLKEYSEDITMDSPGPKAAKDDLAVQAAELQKKYSLFGDLCLELGDDFNKAGKKSAYIFQSFRNFALSFVKNSNEEFADLLRSLPSSSDRFLIRANQQHLPTSVKKRMDDGRFFELVKGGVDMEQTARVEVMDFIKNKNFAPEKCAAVFVAPGNWAHPVEFSNILPNADLMIVEPWPELLSTLISSCMFMQGFSRTTTVIGADERLGKWKRLYHSQMREWMRAGKEIVFFEHPLTWQIHEIKDLMNKLPS